MKTSDGCDVEIHIKGSDVTIGFQRKMRSFLKMLLAYGMVL